MPPESVQNAVLDNYQAVVSAFSEFLTVAVHTILYERDIYPQASFLSARKYNYPVRQNRHPTVCRWIMDAVAAVEVELLKGTVSRTSLIIFSPASIPLERYIFSTENFPIIPPSEHLTTFAFSPSPDASKTANPTTTTTAPPNPPAEPTPAIPPARPPTPLIDLHSQFRGLFARLGPALSKLSPIPPDCTFSLAIELRETPRANPPIGWPMPWVAAEPGLQPADPSSPPPDSPGSRLEDNSRGVEKKSDNKGSDVGTGSKSTSDPSSSGLFPASTPTDDANPSTASASDNHHGEAGSRKPYTSQKGKYLPPHTITTPVRSIEAGPFVMECWVEEGEGKEEAVRAAMAERAEMGEGEGESQS